MLHPLYNAAVREHEMSRDCQLETTIHTCQMQTNCGRGLLTAWRKHNPMYLISTKVNVTLITLSFKYIFI